MFGLEVIKKMNAATKQEQQIKIETYSD